MKKEKEKKFNKLNIINILNLIFITLFLVLLLKLNIIPKKYMMIITVSLTIYELLCILLTNLKFKVTKIIGIVLSSLSIIGCSVLSYYLYTGNTFLDKAFDNNLSTHWETGTKNTSSFINEVIIEFKR